MGRKPKMRASFYQDAQFLLRLGRAIEMDAGLPREWRAEMQEKIKAIAVKLMMAPTRKKRDADVDVKQEA